jgi:hypothetical protein
VQADDEAGVAGEAEREVRVVGFAADGRVPVVERGVAVVQQLELRPQQLLESDPVQVRRLAEGGDEGGELVVGGPDLAEELVQVVAQARGRL